MSYESYKVLVDLPAKNPALGFPAYTQALKGIIENSEPQMVIGIFGTWGSGKTTLMRAIRGSLDRTKTIPVDFSAWRYEKEEHLIIPLLDTIREALVEWSDRNAGVDLGKTPPDPDPGTPREAVLKTASTIGKVMASLLAGLSFKVGLPGAFEISYEANKALSKAKEYGEEETPRRSFSWGKKQDDMAKQVAFRADPRLSQSFYHASFSALKDEFSQFTKSTQGLRIVVFVDDLDRCLPQGALEVLESMKLFFDFKGFIFVVGLDRGVVERLVDARYGGAQNASSATSVGDQRIEGLVKGSDYIKKIFQVPFGLAPVAIDQVEDLLKSIREDCDDLPTEQLADMQGPIRQHLAYMISRSTINPREIKRYINAYTLQMKVKGNLDKHTVLAMQTLSIRPDWEDVNDALQTYGIEFTEALKHYLKGDRGALKDIDPDLKDIPDSFRTYVEEGAPGHSLLEAENLDDYIYSGEATRSSFGSHFVSILRELAGVKRAVREGINVKGATGRKKLQEAWEKLHILLGMLDEIRSFREVQSAETDLKSVKETLGKGERLTGFRAQEWKQHGEELKQLLNRAHSALRELKRRGGLVVA